MLYDVLPLFPPGFSPTEDVTQHSGKLRVLRDILRYLFNHTQEKVAVVSNYTQVSTYVRIYMHLYSFAQNICTEHLHRRCIETLVYVLLLHLTTTFIYLDRNGSVYGYSYIRSSVFFLKVYIRWHTARRRCFSPF